MAIAAFFLGFFMHNSHAVKALGTTGPDPNDFYPATSRMEYVVSRTTQVNNPVTLVKIYCNSSSCQFAIDDYNLCMAAAGSAGNYFDIKGSATSGATATTYQIFNSNHTIAADGSETETRGGLITTIRGVASTSSTCKNDVSVGIISGLQQSRDSGKYVAYVLATNDINTTQNAFRVRVATNGYMVGQDSTLAANQFGLNQVDPLSGYTDYGIRFAGDCSLNTAQYVDAHWYDDDNSDTSIQPTPMRFQLRKTPIGGSGYTLQPFRYFHRTSDGATISYSLSGDGWYTAYSGSNVDVTANFLAEPGYKYSWYWDNIYYDNTLQFQVPFDSIYYLTGCQRPGSRLVASSTVDNTSVGVGDTTTFRHSIIASQYYQDVTAGYTIVRRVNGTQVGSTQTGSTTVNNNGTFSVRNNSFTVSNEPPGSQVCETLTINNPPDDTVVQTRTSTTCTKIVGRPYLTALGSDVWAGGRFDFSSNGCSGITARPSMIQSWVSNNAGAVGRYGVTALGSILGFGSGNQPGGNGLTFANTPGNGSFGATTRCIPNYYNLIGTGGTAWPGMGSIPAGAGKKTYYANTGTTISGGTVPLGTQAVLVVNGNVTITGNINYATGYTSVNAIPALWIISSGNIYIQENVTNLDGLYIAQGTSGVPGFIHTCVRSGATATYSPLTSSVCNTQLTIYGGFIADKILWQRTAGTAAIGQPAAESVYLTPEAYLSSPFTSTSTSLITQDYKELPPIY